MSSLFICFCFFSSLGNYSWEIISFISRNDNLRKRKKNILKCIFSSYDKLPYCLIKRSNEMNFHLTFLNCDLDAQWCPEIIFIFIFVVFKIFHQNLRWNQSSKIGPISFENINYKPSKGNFEVIKILFHYILEFIFSI